ncbi:MAG: EsaB/YukD family protein [Dehalococcoidia bacterium]
MPQVSVQLVHPTTNEHVTARLPDDASVDRLLPALVRKLDLPTQDGRGAITYYVDHKASGRTLGDRDTLAAAGVADGDVLRLRAEWVAGCYAVDQR